MDAPPLFSEKINTFGSRNDGYDAEPIGSILNQATLFPIKLVHEEATNGTRDLRMVGYCEAGVKYAVKRESDAPLLPLAEWIGHNLAIQCEIPIPQFEIVECMNGEVAFGSRWEPACSQIKVFDSAALALLTTHASAISRIFGLDFFLPNPDRHLGNFLFRTTQNEPNCLAFDYSLACVRNGIPFGAHPMGPATKTSVIMREILVKQVKKFDKHQYNKPLEKLREIPDQAMQDILDDAPIQWYTGVTKEQIMNWWLASKGPRIAQVIK